MLGEPIYRLYTQRADDQYELDVISARLIISFFTSFRRLSFS